MNAGAVWISVITAYVIAGMYLFDMLPGAPLHGSESIPRRARRERLDRRFGALWGVGLFLIVIAGALLS